MTRHFTNEEYQTLVATACGELTVRKAAKVLGVSPQRICQIIEEKFVRTATSRDVVKDRVKKNLVTLKQEIELGLWTQKKLCKHLNIGDKILKSVLIELDIVIKPLKIPAYVCISKPKIVLSPEDLQLYKNKETTRAKLAIKYNCSVACISLALRRQHTYQVMANHEMFVLSPQQIDSLFNRKVTIMGLAKESCVNVLTVRNAMLRQGVVIKSSS